MNSNDEKVENTNEDTNDIIQSSQPEGFVMEKIEQWRKVNVIKNVARQFIKVRGLTVNHSKNDETLQKEDKPTALSQPKAEVINCKVCNS